MASPRLGDATKHVISIGMLHGYLCMNIIDIRNSRHGVESWVMKEYGNTESWTHWCLVKNVELERRPGLCNYKVMESRQKGKILVLTPSGYLLTYDLRRQQCLDKQLRVQGFDPKQGMQLHCPGFFSLLQWPMQPPKQLAG
ncbi:hypothetical protein RND81_12G242500 [Saponaria officinalis]|uniref:F-box associated domain-containing protein n=1 Tax=Saponaria officinalis TaxID=3572 RepID=A0AAW1HEY3_SAPOF